MDGSRKAQLCDQLDDKLYEARSQLQNILQQRERWDNETQNLYDVVHCMLLMICFQHAPDISVKWRQYSCSLSVRVLETNFKVCVNDSCIFTKALQIHRTASFDTSIVIRLNEKAFKPTVTEYIHFFAAASVVKTHEAQFDRVFKEVFDSTSSLSGSDFDAFEVQHFVVCISMRGSKVPKFLKMQLVLSVCGREKINFN